MLRDVTEGRRVGRLNSRCSLGFKFRELDPKINEWLMTWCNVFQSPTVLEAPSNKTK